MNVQKPRVIICDDSETIRAVVERILSAECDCCLVESAEAALAEANARVPDLVVSDLMLEGMSGFDLCAAFRADPRLAPVPIILLTSNVESDSRTTGLEVGADDYLHKPIQPRELLARARSLLRLRRSTLELARRTEELEAANRELTQAHTALVRAEKLATLGTLVAGIAHEINNPLAFMMAGSSQLRVYVEDINRGLSSIDAQLDAAGRATVGRMSEALSEIDAIAGEVTEGSERLSRIAADLKAFATAQTCQIAEVKLEDEVRRAWSMAELKAKGRCQLSIEGALPHVTTDRHKLGQVLLNLMINAIQAMDEGGTISIRSHEGMEDVQLELQDSGKGIPSEIQSRIFDPFFTTKPPGQGTGLGLSVAYGIMRALRGGIDVRSPPGGGACFALRLPRRLQLDNYYERRAR